MYIIDGHNLIPNLPGISLEALDDEEELIVLLQNFARLRRKHVEVFFDGAPPGQAGVRVYGTVRAHFVASGMTADEAIRLFLVGLSRRARSATVVSSDRQVQANARALQVAVLPSSEFARDLVALRDRPPGTGARKARQGSTHQGMSSGELQDWLDLFGLDPSQADKPIEPPRRPRLSRGKGTKPSRKR